MNKKKKKLKRVHVQLTQSQIARLRGIAGKSGYGISEMIRRAIDMYLNSHRKPQG